MNEQTFQIFSIALGTLGSFLVGLMLYLLSTLPKLIMKLLLEIKLFRKEIAGMKENGAEIPVIKETVRNLHGRLSRIEDKEITLTDCPCTNQHSI